jgi:hypothetical protein
MIAPMTYTMRITTLVALILFVSRAIAAPDESAITSQSGVRIDVAPTRVVQADSLDTFGSALDSAAPGEHIVLADGVYDSPRQIVINRAGTADKPIIVKAQTIGGAEIKGKAGISFGDSAAYVVVQGFKFTHSNEEMRLPVGSHHLRITRNIFSYANDARSPYVVVSGSDCELDHNTFQDKSTEGCMITVQGPGGSGMAQRTWIHHNLFKNFRPTANNCSAIQIGLSGRSLSSANSLVEHNLFINCRGENEGGICNKSCDNLYRFNTFADGTTELSLRHGNGCIVYGNFFLGTDGIRFFGHDHRIFSNYFERCRIAVTIGNGGGIVPRDPLTSHDKPVNVAVVFNTLVNNRTNIQMLRRNNGLGADDIAVANNVIVGGGQAARIAGPMKDPVWAGNLVWNTEGGAGDMPAGAFEQVDPMLRQAGTDGPYIPQRSSPVIGRSAGKYDYVTVDIDGQPRGRTISAGADEISDAEPVNRILGEADVGPQAR